MIKGIGYQRYKKMRASCEGLSATEMELPGNERYAVYFGRAHVYDFETNVLARSPLKIGRAKFITALQRGRNQPGIDFRIYAEIIVNSNKATRIAEEVIASELVSHHISSSQGQEEIYNINDDELETIVINMVSKLEKCMSGKIIEVNMFEDDNVIPLRDKKMIKNADDSTCVTNSFYNMFGDLNG